MKNLFAYHNVLQDKKFIIIHVIMIAQALNQIQVQEN